MRFNNQIWGKILSSVLYQLSYRCLQVIQGAPVWSSIVTSDIGSDLGNNIFRAEINSIVDEIAQEEDR